MIRKYEGTNFVTGLRAYAALAVVLAHCGGAGLRSLGEFGNALADLGSTGVYVFFVISGFSVSASYEAVPSFRQFFVRRVFRLVPVYYAFIAIAVALLSFGAVDPNHWSAQFAAPINAYNILMHCSFLGFLDYRVNNSIIGIEWSLYVEMFWYLVLPPILGVIIARPRAIGAALAVAVAMLFIQKPMIRYAFGPDSQYIIQWSPLTYAPAFMLGASAYFVRQWRKPITGRPAELCLALAFGLLLLGCFVSFMEIRLLIPLITFLVLIAGCDGYGATKLLLINRFVLYVGTISYSIYLWHPLVIQVLEKQGLAVHMGSGPVMFLAVGGITFVLSMLTYRLIEIPANRLGRQMATARLLPARLSGRIQ